MVRCSSMGNVVNGMEAGSEPDMPRPCDDEKPNPADGARETTVCPAVSARCGTGKGATLGTAAVGIATHGGTWDDVRIKRSGTNPTAPGSGRAFDSVVRDAGQTASRADVRAPPLGLDSADANAAVALAVLATAIGERDVAACKALARTFPVPIGDDTGVHPTTPAVGHMDS